MPFINVKVSAAPSAGLSEALAKDITEVTARVLGKRADITSVAISYMAPEHWIIGGKSLAQHGKASFWLDIKITNGTNVKDEKAKYLSEIFALMGHHLKQELHEESYILIDEASGDAYGFGGLTQEHRYIAGKLR